MKRLVRGDRSTETVRQPDRWCVPAGTDGFGAGRTDRRQRPSATHAAVGRTLIEALDRRELLTTFVVTSNADSGTGTFRQAILDSNQAGGSNTIDFAITGTNTTIKPRSGLPTISTPVVIDGTSEPGYTNAPLIVLNGKFAGAGTTGLLITAGNCTVRGLVINNFDGTGLELENGGNNLIQGNYIGTDSTGTQSQPNGAASSWDPGLLVDNSGENTIGGTAPGAGNLLSGNDADGLDLEGSGTGNLVEGNKIGTDVTGTTALANNFDGLWIGLGAGGDTIGGAVAGAGNVISGNAGNGFEIDTTDGGGTGPGDLIQGNFIGTNAAGNAAIGNAIGMNIECAGNNTIGGTAAGAGNIVSGNNSVGLWFYGSGCTQNLVEGNVIGSDPTGTVSLPNGTGAAVLLTDSGDTTSVYASQNTIGGTAAGAGNLIAFSAGDGIDVEGGQENCILANSFHANAGLAINLQQTPSPYTNGVLTPSDPNQGINIPVFSSAVWNGSSLTVSGYIGQPNTAAAGFAGDLVELYTLDGTRAGAQSEGQTLVGTLTANANGAFSGTITASGLSANVAVTATATDTLGDTSQFAAALVATNSGGLTATSTVLQASPAPSIYGQNVTLTASVESLLGILLGATGTMAFYDGTTLLGTSPVSGGTATLAVSSFSAGTHNVTATFGGDTLDASSSSNPLAQLVNPAPLTITASAATINYGQSLPTFSATFSGLVAGDTPANLSARYSVRFSTSAATGSPGGSYAITPSGFNDPNYTVTYVAGTLTIAPVPLTVRVVSNSTVYGQPDPLFTVLFSGLVNDDKPTDFSGLVLNSPANATSPVGTYSVTPSGIVTTSYTITYISGTLTVTPARLTVTTAGTSKVYGQANPTFTAVFTGLANGDTPASVGTVSFTTGASTGSPVGTYQVTPGGLNDPNYTILYVPGTLSITPAPVTVTTDLSSKTYGQPNPTFTATFSGLVNGDTPAQLGMLAFTTNATTSSPVGTYSVTPRGLSDSNYAFSYTSGSLTVAAAPLIVSANASSKTYGQPNPAFTATFSGLVNGDTPAQLGTISFSTNASTSSPAGTYLVTSGGLSDSNYTISYVPADLSVNPAALTVSADDASRIYGRANPTFTATFTGLVNGDTPAQLGTLAFTTNATPGSPVGVYVVAPSGLDDANYTISYVSGTLSVGAAHVIVAADNAAKTYGQPNPTFNATFSGLVNGDTPAQLGTISFSTNANTRSSAGTYPVTPGGLNDPNYTFTYSAGTLSVTAAPLVVSADSSSKTYGQPNPTFTAAFTGLVNGDTPAVVGTVAFNTSATDSSDAGSYSVFPSGLTDANYEITYQPGLLDVTPAPLTVIAVDATRQYGEANPAFTAIFNGLVNGDTTASVGAIAFGTDADVDSSVGTYAVTPSGLTDPNYSVTYQVGTLTVEAAPLTITAENAMRPYGQPNPQFQATVTGLVNGDTLADLGTLSFQTVANAFSPVGTYSITPFGLNAANYSVTYVPGLLNVGNVTTIVASASVDTVSYGQAVEFSAIVSNALGPANPPSGTVNFYDGTVLLGSASLSNDTASLDTSALSSGSHAITAVYNGDTADAPATSNSLTVDVSPAPLIVQVTGMSRPYGQPNPGFSATYTGLVDGDSPGVLGAASFSTDAQTASAVGAYVVTASGLSDANYAITYQSGTLTVTPAPLTVTVADATKQYGEPDPAFRVAYSGLVADDTPESLGALAIMTDASASSPVGHYMLCASGLTDPNYSVTYRAGTLTVTPAPLIVAAIDTTRLYGQPNPSFRAMFQGLVNGDTPTTLGPLGFDTPAQPSSDVGDYTITPLGLSDPNYVITYQTGTLAIDPAPLTVAANDATKIAGAPNPPFTATITGLTAGDSAGDLGSLTFVTAADPSSGVGHYAVAPAGLSDPNYLIDFESGSLTVLPRVLSLKAQAVAATAAVPFQGLVASFTDNLPAPAGNDVATISWGDGQITSAVVSYDSARQHFDISGAHTYASPGVYMVGIQVESGTDDDSATGTATVAAAPLLVSPVAVAATAGAPFSGVVASFSDGSTARPSAYVATVYWGDGQMSAGTIAQGADGMLTVSGTNTYDTEGVYAVRVVITALDGRQAQAFGMAVVADPALTIQGIPLSTSAAEPFDGVIAHFQVASPSDSAADFDASIDWGDGITTTGTIAQTAPGQFSVAGSHTYLVAGNVDAQVVVTGDMTLRGAAAVPATILRVNPTGPGTTAIETETPSRNLSLGSVTVNVTAVPVVTGDRSATAPAPVAVALIVGNNALGGPMTASDGPTASASPNLDVPHAIAPEHPEPDHAAVAAAVPAAVISVTAPIAHPSTPVAPASTGPIDIRVALPAAPAFAFASLALPPEQLWQALDKLEEQVASEPPLEELAGVVGLGTVAYVGYALLHTRGGYLLLSLVSAHPLWGEMDPLAVLLHWEKERNRTGNDPHEEGNDDESLESIVENHGAQEQNGSSHDAHQPRSVQHYHQHIIRRERARPTPRSRNQRTQNTKDAL